MGKTLGPAETDNIAFCSCLLQKGLELKLGTDDVSDAEESSVTPSQASCTKPAARNRGGSTLTEDWVFAVDKTPAIIIY